MKDLDAAPGKQYFKQTADIDMSGQNWIPFDFGGVFDGNGKKIRNVRIDQSGNNNVGFFSKLLSDGLLENVHLEGVNVKGKMLVGGLVGESTGSISNSFVTGSVTGSSNYVGGLVGYSGGSISNSYATASVAGSGADCGAGCVAVGGLAGGTSGSITDSYATGSVTGYNIVGGLVGWSFGGSVISITKSYATGSVTGNDEVGGLIGFSSIATNIVNSYATGSVTGIAWLGGLVGNSSGSITNSYANGSVSSVSSVIGTNHYVGGLVGYSGYDGSITNSYATGRVTGTSIYVGGLVGYSERNKSNSYYDTNTTGHPGVDGRTTDQMKQGTPTPEIYTNWSTTVWDFGTPTDPHYPTLKW